MRVLAHLCRCDPPSCRIAFSILYNHTPTVGEDRRGTSVAFSVCHHGLGYLGGGIALVIAMLILQFGGQFGLHTTASRLQWCLILMGCWWALFSLPALLVLRDKQPTTTNTRKTLTQTVRLGATDVSQTLRKLRKNVPLALFLLSFLFYNDGVQTIISQASTFALQELSFPEAELMAVILMIQFLALPGSIIIGRYADTFGQRRTLLACLLVWGI